MLLELHIRNYAIISNLQVSFDKGLNILTGETGAGKSIIMGALGLVLGNRADTGSLHHAGEKCVVEAVFKPVDSEALRRFFDEEDIDQDQQILIRREITPNGKSRGFINDTPVNLNQMKRLASQLVDLHQQFDTLELNDHAFQLEVVDAVAGNLEQAAEYRRTYKQWAQARQQLANLQAARATALANADYQQFLLSELEDAAFKENELEELERELDTLSHAEGIKQAMLAAVYGLHESEAPMLQQLKNMGQQLQQASQRHKRLEGLADRMKSVQIELQDIAGELQQLADALVMDPERMQWATARIDLGNRLLKKHQVQDTAGLLAIQRQLQEALAASEQQQTDLQTLEADCSRLEQWLYAAGAGLSQQRQTVLAAIDAHVLEVLHRVGMPNAAFKADLVPQSQPGPDGFDEIRFLFDANKTGRFEPLERVASGGELSRLMLAVKSLVAGSLALPTLIFDEIDSGISGEAARQVGLILKDMCAHHQMICITHQPQIAARADSHFFIYKKQDAGAIETQLRKLSQKERVEAIAGMLGGEMRSEATLKTAREMIAG